MSDGREHEPVRGPGRRARPPRGLHYTREKRSCRTVLFVVNALACNASGPARFRLAQPSISQSLTIRSWGGTSRKMPWGQAPPARSPPAACCWSDAAKAATTPLKRGNVPRTRCSGFRSEREAALPSRERREIDATHPTSAGNVACGARWRVGVSPYSPPLPGHITEPGLRDTGHRGAVEITVDPQLRQVVPFGVRLTAPHALPTRLRRMPGPRRPEPPAWPGTAGFGPDAGVRCRKSRPRPSVGSARTCSVGLRPGSKSASRGRQGRGRPLSVPRYGGVNG